MAETTNRELKLIISATDPEFQRVIKNVNKALKGLADTTKASTQSASQSLAGLSKQAERAGKKTGQSIERGSKRANRALGALQRGLFNIRQGIISLAAAAAAGGITKVAADFELALANINTLLPDGAVSIERYREQLIELSKVSSKEVIDLSKGLYQTISAGVPAVEGASGAFALLERAQASAVAGLSTTEEAVNAIVSVVNAYGATNITAAEASDKLLKTVQLGRTTFPELARAIGRVAPSAAAFGVSADDLLSVLIQLTRAGLNTNESVTGLRNLLKSLTQPTQETERVLDNLNRTSGKAKVEFSAQALAANGLTGQLKLLTDATGGNAAVLSRLFPNLRATLPALVAVGENATETAGFFRQLADSAGTVDEAVAKVAPTFSEVAKVTKSVFQSAFIDAGQRVIPLLIERLEALQATVEENSSSFSNFFEGAIGAADVTIRLFADTISLLVLAVEGLSTAVGKASVALFGFATLGPKVIPAIKKLATTLSATFVGTFATGLLALGPAVNLAITGALVATFAVVNRLFNDEAEKGAEAFKERLRQATEELKAIRSDGFQGFEDFRNVQAQLAKGEAVQVDAATRSEVELRLRPDGRDAFTSALATLIEDKDATISATFRAEAKGLIELQDRASAIQRSITEVQNKGEKAFAAQTLPVLKQQLNEINQEISRALGEESALTQQLQNNEELAKSFDSILTKITTDTSRQIVTIADTTAQQIVTVQQLIRQETEARIKEGVDKEQAALEARAVALETFRSKAAEAEAALNAQSTEFEEARKAFQNRINSFLAEGKKESQAILAIEKEQVGIAFARVKGQRDNLEAKRATLQATVEQLAIDNSALEAEAKRAGLEERRRRLAEKRRKEDARNAKKENAKIRFERLRAALAREQEKINEKAAAFELQRLKIDLKRNQEDQKRSKTLRELDRLLGEELEIIKKIEGSEREVAKIRFESRETIAFINQQQKEAALALAAQRAEGLISDKELETELKNNAALFDKIRNLQAKQTRQAINDATKRSADAERENTKTFLDAVKERRDKAQAEEEAAAARLKKSEENLYKERLARALAFFQEEQRRKDALRTASEATSLPESLVALAGLEAIEKLNLVQEDSKTIAVEALAAQLKVLGTTGKVGEELQKKFGMAKGEGLALEGSLVRGGIALGKALAAAYDLNQTAIVDSLGDAGDEFGKALFAATSKGVDAAVEALKSTGDTLTATASLVSLDFQAFGKAFSDNIVGGTAKLTGYVKSLTTNLVDLASSQLVLMTAKATKDLVSEVGEGFNKFGGDAAKRVRDGLQKGGELLGQTISVGFKFGASILATAFEGYAALIAKAINSVLQPVVKALQAPLDLIFGSLGEALGLITRTKKEEREERAKRAERNRLLQEEFEARLTEAEAAGATNEEIARLQAQFRARRDKENKEEDEEETPSGLMASAFEQAIEMALNLARQLPLLVQQFLSKLIEALPQIIPALVSALSETIRILAENLGDIITVTLNSVIDALPELITAIAESLDDVLEGVLEGLILLVERLPEIATNLIQGLIAAAPRLIRVLVDKLPELVTALAQATPEIILAISAAIPSLILELTLAIPRIILAFIAEIPKIVGSFIRGFANGVTQVFSGVGSAFSRAGELIVRPIKNFFKEDLPGIIQDLLDIDVNTGNETVDRVIEGGSKVQAFISTGGVSALTELFHEGGAINAGMRDKSTARMFRELGAAGFQAGGLVTASASGLRASAVDDVPAVLQTGEGVLSRVGMRAAGGTRGLDRMNAGQSPMGDVKLNVGIVPSAGGLNAAAAALLPMLISGIVSEIQGGTGSITTALDGQSGSVVGYSGVPGRG